LPQLIDNRPTKTISLTGHPGSELVIYGSVLLRDRAAIGIQAGDSEDTIGLKSVPAMIKSWNFTDENDQPMPINSDSVGLLTSDDIKEIIDAIISMSQEEKKD